jgi:DNA replication and repair protein RecF
LKLLRLRARGLRNLDDLDLRPGSAITVFHGPNASGKTSLLEAIHILSCGKSFRTAQLAKAIRYESGSCLVAGELETAAGIIPMGLEFDREHGRVRMRAGGASITTLSEFAAIMPIVAIHQESHRLFSGGPQYRRQFVDWGLFHVEQSFMPTWQRYRRALKQRNALLQSGARGLSGWDAELAFSGGEIDRMRRRMVAAFVPHFQRMTDLLGGASGIDLIYRPGWKEGVGLDLVLREGLAGDSALGYTRHGPHRADIEFRRGKVLARDDLSRGQLKTLVCAAAMAQAVTFTEATGRSVILLVDDLTAELDDAHSRRLLDRIVELRLQTFITGAEERLLDLARPYECKVFHVERGKIREVV